MKNFSTREITLTAVLTAVILVLGLVPNFGYVSVTPMVGFTTIHIPVFIGAYFGSRKVGGFLGLVFGFTSLFVAFTRPVGLLDPVFTNPIVSVLPRFLVGFFAYDVLQFIKKRITNKLSGDVLFFAIMTVLHSFLVITLLYISAVNYWYFDIYGISEGLTREGTLGVIDYVAKYFIGGNSFLGFLLTIVLVNSILEVVLCTIVGSSVVNRLKVALSIK